MARSEQHRNRAGIRSRAGERGYRRIAGFRRRHALALLAVAVLGVGLAAVFLGGNYDGPICRPHSSRCERTKDGVWVPAWYFRGLQKAQKIPRKYWLATGGGVAGGLISGSYIPLARGAQPTTAELEVTGASSAEIEQAQAGGDGGDDGNGDGDDDGGGDGDG